MTVEQVRSGGAYLTSFSSVPTSVRGKAEIFLSMGYGCLLGMAIRTFTVWYCSRYRVGTRGRGGISTGTNHLGFRWVKSASVVNR